MLENKDTVFNIEICGLARLGMRLFKDSHQDLSFNCFTPARHPWVSCLGLLGSLFHSFRHYFLNLLSPTPSCVNSTVIPLAALQPLKPQPSIREHCRRGREGARAGGRGGQRRDITF